MEYMNVVDFEKSGPPDAFTILRKEKPKFKNDEVLIKIAATTVTGFDLIRRTKYKVWDGIDTLLGMECSGEIADVGTGVSGHHKGDKVCALLEGGGYAEYVAVPACQVIPIPKGMRLEHAATLPYASSVVWHTFFRVGKLSKNCSILIHNAIGEFSPLAIQLAKIHGCIVFVTGFGEPFGQIEYCKDIGADYFIKYDKHFIDSVLNKTGGRGVDFIFDTLGLRVNDNLKILSRGGTLAIVDGYHGISEVDVDFGLMQSRQIKLVGLFFVRLPIEEKRKILEEIVQKLWPMIEKGRLIPRVYKRRYVFPRADCRFDFNDVGEAHRAVKRYENFGDKIFLVPTRDSGQIQTQGTSSGVENFVHKLMSWAFK